MILQELNVTLLVFVPKTTCEVFTLEGAKLRRFKQDVVTGTSFICIKCALYSLFTIQFKLKVD